jgi:AcrR family transcriptional regulator
LIDAALSLFRRKGFERTTVDEIARSAKVSRRTFFRYFENKEAVVFPHDAERIAAFEQLVSHPIHGETALDTVRRALIVLAREYELERERILAQDRLIKSSPLLLNEERRVDFAWETAIGKALTKGSPAPATSRAQIRMLAAAIVGVVRVALDEWAESGGTSDLVRLGTEALDLLARGSAHLFMAGGRS